MSSSNNETVATFAPINMLIVSNILDKMEAKDLIKLALSKANSISDLDSLEIAYRESKETRAEEIYRKFVNPVKKISGIRELVVGKRYAIVTHFEGTIHSFPLMKLQDSTLVFVEYDKDYRIELDGHFFKIVTRYSYGFVDILNGYRIYEIE